MLIQLFVLFDDMTLGRFFDFKQIEPVWETVLDVVLNLSLVLLLVDLEFDSLQKSEKFIVS